MIFFNQPKTPLKRERNGGGYILLLTVLILSIMLSVGFGIYRLSLKEIVLSSFLHNSEKALAAADRAAECALYWDRSYPQNSLPHTVFATSSSFNLSPFIADNARCHDGTVDRELSSIWSVMLSPTAATTTFRLNFSDGTCADVFVAKVGDESTNVISDGFNTCDVSVSRRTQREIAVYY